MKQRNLFKSISALLGAISVFSTAQAEDLLQSNQLRASDGQMFAVRANVEGFPNGLAYDVVLTNVETVIYQTARYFDIEVVYINDCKNYDGVPFTAYLACPAKYDPFHDRSVAKLDRSACHSSDKEFHTDFNFNTHGGWYVSGRTGYYQAQRCQPRVAVRIGEKWLHDPITNSHNFGVMFDYTNACPQGRC